MQENSFLRTVKESPVIVSMPHNGIEIPESIGKTMQNDALEVPDTDWFIQELYSFCEDLDVSLIIPKYSRYVIDLNRSIDKQSFYPGQNETELCPLTQFDLKPIYKPGFEPSVEEVERRVELFWRPYHQGLEDLIQRNIKKFGVSVLLDAHSIATEVPRFFANRLPDLNLGTSDGASCSKNLEEKLISLPRNSFSLVANERFKGGYITRHYGRPEENSHAVQLELSQDTYMRRGQRQFQEEYAQELIAYLKTFVHALTEWSTAQIEERENS